MFYHMASYPHLSFETEPSWLTVLVWSAGPGRVSLRGSSVLLFPLAASWDHFVLEFWGSWSFFYSWVTILALRTEGNKPQILTLFFRPDGVWSFWEEVGQADDRVGESWRENEGMRPDSRTLSRKHSWNIIYAKSSTEYLLAKNNYPQHNLGSDPGFLFAVWLLSWYLTCVMLFIYNGNIPTSHVWRWGWDKILFYKIPAHKSTL